MSQSGISNLLAGHFTRLDQLADKSIPGKDPQPKSRAVMAFRETERNLYLVWDLISITCNAGMGAWIHYHIGDEGWIDDAARAFRAIGHPEIGDLLDACRIRYLSSDGNWDHWNDDDLSEPVWEQEEQIIRDLSGHLMAAGFPLQT